MKHKIGFIGMIQLVCIPQRYYFVVCFTVARETDVRFFFALVYIPLRYIDAFVKRVAFA